MRHPLLPATPLFLALLLPAACREAPPSPPPEAAEPETSEAPLEIEGTAVAPDGVPIHYRAEGRGEPALVFVHCWSCDGGYWRHQMEHFAPHHRVVALDLAGHGGSGMGREAWNVYAYATDVRAVVDELDLERILLVGHSMGGPVAVEAARLMPDRVVGIVGVDTLGNVSMGGEDPDEATLRAQAEQMLAPMREDFAAFTRQFVGENMFHPDTDPAVKEEIVADMAAAPPEVAIPSLESLLLHDLGAREETLGMPVRTLNARREEAVQVEAMRRIAPDFEAAYMDGVGHFPHLEKPEEFNRRLEAVIEEITTPPEPSQEP